MTTEEALRDCEDAPIAMPQSYRLLASEFRRLEAENATLRKTLKQSSDVVQAFSIVGAVSKEVKEGESAASWTKRIVVERDAAQAEVRRLRAKLETAYAATRGLCETHRCEMDLRYSELRQLRAITLATVRGKMNEIERTIRPGELRYAMLSDWLDDPARAATAAEAPTESPEVPCSEFRLPVVAGRRSLQSNADLEHACLVHIERLQLGIGDYDSAMLATFAEAVRMVREYTDAMQVRNHNTGLSGGTPSAAAPLLSEE